MLLHQGQAKLSNTGWKLWQGSYAMARYLERLRPNSSDWDGISVLDLSCGIGLCGLALCQVCADVTLTELSENVPAAQHNLAVNCTESRELRCKSPVLVPYEWGATLPQ